MVDRFANGLTNKSKDFYGTKLKTAASTLPKLVFTDKH